MKKDHLQIKQMNQNYKLDQKTLTIEIIKTTRLLKQKLTKLKMKRLRHSQKYNLIKIILFCKNLKF